MCVLGILLALIERNTSVSDVVIVGHIDLLCLAKRPSGGCCNGKDHVIIDVPAAAHIHVGGGCYLFELLPSCIKENGHMDRYVATVCVEYYYV